MWSLMKRKPSLGALVRTSRRLSSTPTPTIDTLNIRCITMDVTGTVVSFSGRLGSWYALSAKRVGVTPPKLEAIESAFRDAYRETTRKYPCFGGTDISSKDWWRICVLRSFELVGTEYACERDTERLFQRIYALFGSHSTYAAFPDAVPFLKWAERRGLVTGVVSNADERYGDAILPMLDLAHDISFECFSKDVLVEKPDKRIFDFAVSSADAVLRARSSPEEEYEPLLPEQVLHIGNDLEKDYFGARNAGMHAVLLDRFAEEERAKEWRKQGAPVMRDFLDVVEWLGMNKTRFNGNYLC